MLVALAACATPTGYVYSPQDACHWTEGYPAVTQLVPPEAPQGSIEVSSFGVVAIRPDGQRAVAALHVRLAVTNDGDASPWTVVPADQVLDLPGLGRTGPMAISPEMSMSESMVVGQRERLPLDLYFALPASVASEDALVGFDVLWQVETPARRYASRTHFDRYLATDPSLWSCDDSR